MWIKVAPGEVIKFESMPTWEEEFDELTRFGDDFNVTLEKSKLKVFIQSLLDQQCKKLLEKIKLEKFSKEDLEYQSDRGYWNGRNDTIDDLEEIKKNLAEPTENTGF